MIELIKRYFYARFICKRYGYKFKTTLSSTDRNGSSGYMMPEMKVVFTPLTSNRFYDTLFHEIGHVIDFKLNPKNKEYVRSLSHGEKYFLEKTGLKRELYYNNDGNRPVSRIILREMRASRIAMRLLKSTGKIRQNSYKDLMKSFNSYIRGMDNLLIADVAYRASRVIGGF